MMQSKMQQVQLPVFKPLNTTKSSENVFVYDRAMTANVNQNNSSTFQLARPNEMHSVSKVRTSQLEESIRISPSIHAKLQQEADVIRRWKIQTEIELKQKEKKILQASTTVESLRKSILELQLQNENLSLKMKEEMDNREDILQRINSTRDLCNLLKNHTTIMEEKLMQCETEKTQLKYLEKEHLVQFEDLSEKFQKLEISSVEDHNKLMNQLKLERDDRSKIEKDMEYKLANAEDDLRKLIDQCDDKDIEIREVSSRLQRNEDRIHTYQLTIETSQQTIEELSKDLLEKDGKLQELQTQLCSNMEEKNELETKINKMELELQHHKVNIQEMERTILTNKSTFDSSIFVLQKDLETARLQLEGKILRISKIEEEIANGLLVCENIKCSRDTLLMEKTELETKICELQNNLKHIEAERNGISQEVHRLQTQLNIRTSELEEKSTLFDELQIENQALQNEIAQKEIICNCLKENMNSLNETVTSKEKSIQQRKQKEKELNEQIDRILNENAELQDNLNTKCGENKNKDNGLKGMKVEIQVKDKELSAKEKDINKLKKDIERQKKEKCSAMEELQVVKGDFNELRKEQENLYLEITQTKKENEKLKDLHNETDKSLSSEREIKTKKFSELEAKQKELKSDITSKNKQIKDLEKDLKSTKSKLNQKQKATEDGSKQTDMLTQELQDSNKANIELEKKLQDTLKNIELEKNNFSESKTQVAVAKKQLNQAVKDKNDSIGKCEAQIAEMMATLQKYKQENEKIVDQKEKELDSVRIKCEQSLSLKQKSEQLCDDFKQETDELRKKIDVLEKEKRNISQISCDDGKLIQELKSKLSEKEEEIKDINMKLSKEMIKAASQACSTQTSPLPFDKTQKQIITTPLRRTFIPTTPKIHPNPSDLCTPKILHKTPIAEDQTPLRSTGILRGINSVSKKRRVAFIPNDEKHHDSDSSSSELMEVEPADIERFTKEKTTPIHIRPSPKVKISGSNKQTPTLNRVPRGPPVKLNSKQSSMKGFLDKENDQFNSLFPNQDTKIHKKKETGLAPNMRKTPSKPGRAKFFSVSPRQRKETSSKYDKVEDMAWFDLDSVFGFGPED